MTDENKSVRRAIRIYEALLRLYPRGHRRMYGTLMVQLFRDQCRDACQHGPRRALARLCFRTLEDLTRSAFREQLAQQTHRMNHMPPKKLSWILFTAAAGAGLVSCNFLISQPGIALGLAYFAGLILLLRAVVEWKRPPNELMGSLIGGAAIAVIFALIFPVWAKLNLPVIPALVAVPLLLNCLVPLIKTGLCFAGPRA